MSLRRRLGGTFAVTSIGCNESIPAVRTADWCRARVIAVACLVRHRSGWGADRLPAGRGRRQPDEPYSTPGFAADVIAVLDHLGLRQVDVYGTSMGGRVAQWLAVLHADRVRALVLGCTSPGKAHGFERSQEIRRALAQPDQAARDDVLADLMYTPQWRRLHPGPYPVLGDTAMPAYAKDRHLVASNSHEAWAELPSIKAPTLVLHGPDDIFSPAANARLLADRIPGATPS